MIYRIFIAVGLLTSLGCSSSGFHQQFAQSEEAGSADRIWSAKVDGAVTGLSMSSDAGFSLVSSVGVPPKKSDDGRLLSNVALFDRSGDRQWVKQVSGSVTSLAVGADGTSTVSTDQSELSVWTAQGEDLWKQTRNCHPRWVEARSQVLCVHVNDKETSFEFEVYSKDGKRVRSEKTSRNVVDYVLAPDEGHLVTALAAGRVNFYNSRYNRVWSKNVPGAITGISISSGRRPRVALLYQKAGQNLVVYDHRGRLVSKKALPFFAEAVGITANGSQVVLYGNSPQGQRLAVMRVGKTEINWQHLEKHFADYSSDLQVEDGEFLVGLRADAKTRLMSFDFSGGLKWSIPLQTHNGAHLLSSTLVESRAFVAVATDESRVSVYKGELTE